jgi:hypothetical protein
MQHALFAHGCPPPLSGRRALHLSACLALALQGLGKTIQTISLLAYLACEEVSPRAGLLGALALHQSPARHSTAQHAFATPPRSSEWMGRLRACLRRAGDCHPHPPVPPRLASPRWGLPLFCKPCTLCLAPLSCRASGARTWWWCPPL